MTSDVVEIGHAVGKFSLNFLSSYNERQ